MDSPTCINLGGPLNTISRSPDGNHVIVAGRDVLKIVSIKDVLKHVQSLRVAKMNLNFTGNDCAWHPMEAYKHTIATAATNGAVVIWNISKEGQAKQERIINDHTRAVNRLSWHPENGQLLLSGSQDGSMKLWDFRDPSQNCCKLTFHGKSESVRDVQFSPHWANYFAAAFDNGTLQIWDIRGKTQQYERKITAHQGLVLCVDWHPEDKSLLATGGRDRTVKVWDLNSKAGVPTHTIQTISSVSRVKWRPDHRYHIASCAGLMDFHVHIWDARKPYIPLGSLGKHRDVATGLLWTSKYSMLSCGKDSTLVKHDTADAIRPVVSIRTSAISWAVSNEVSVANDPVIRADVHDLTPTNIPAPPPLFSDRNAGVVKVFSAFGSFKELGPAMDSTVFQYLAENYKLFGSNVSDLCEHNCSIATHVKQHQIAQVWQLIKLFYEPSELEQNDVELNTEVNYAVNPSPADLPLQRSSVSESEYDETVLLDAKSLESGLIYTDITQLLSSEAVIPLSPLPVRAPSSLLTDDSNSPNRSHPGTPPRERTDDMPLQMTAHSQLIDDAILKRNFGSQSSSASTTPLPSRPATPKISLAQASVGHSTDHSPPMWDFQESIHNLLENYAEKGDVQNCVAICMVLRDKLEVNKDLLLKWFTSYIDLLQRHQLWSIANIHIKECSLVSISKLNQQSTTIHTGCPHCGKPLFSQGWACEKCKMLTAQCSVCRQPVKGMYVWCQGCGHGGHLSHIREWFQVQGQKLCPSGCAHYCIYKPCITKTCR